MAVDHFDRFADLQVPDQDLRGKEGEGRGREKGDCEVLLDGFGT